jgi:hypothetical protein
MVYAESESRRYTVADNRSKSADERWEPIDGAVRAFSRLPARIDQDVYRPRFPYPEKKAQ